MSTARTYASRASLLANVSLLACNLTVFFLTGSLALLSSAVDSLLDLISQAVLLYAARGNTNVRKTRYPVGRSRMEPVGIVVVSSVMGVASFEIILESAVRLGTGFSSSSSTTSSSATGPRLELYTIVMVVVAVVIKAILYVICKRLEQESGEMKVLAEDHRNDVLANGSALTFAVVASRVKGAWFVDPLGAIVIAIYIFFRWVGVGREHAGMLVGKGADADFVASVEGMIEDFDPIMKLDVVSAYHFGARYLVEAEVVVPRETSIVVAHDLALALQKKIEQLEDVERAHVHVDYQYRDEDEHCYKDVVWNEHEVSSPRGGEESPRVRQNARTTGELYNRRRRRVRESNNDPSSSPTASPEDANGNDDAHHPEDDDDEDAEAVGASSRPTPRGESEVNDHPKSNRAGRPEDKQRVDNLRVHSRSPHRHATPQLHESIPNRGASLTFV